MNTISGSTGTPYTAGCWVHCQSDAVCAAGETCNPYTHACGGAVDPTLEDDGQPCSLGSDCRSGWCISQGSTGFLDGMCVSQCVEPGAASYGAAPLPAADCPGNEVCVADPAEGPGYLTECRPRCTTSSDCRTDYVCNHVSLDVDGRLLRHPRRSALAGALKPGAGASLPARELRTRSHGALSRGEAG